MCSFKAPKIKAPPPAAQFQQVQVPKDMTNSKGMRLRRRGMWSAIMTSPSGISGAPNTTGGAAGVMGG